MESTKGVTGGGMFINTNTASLECSLTKPFSFTLVSIANNWSVFS